MRMHELLIGGIANRQRDLGVRGRFLAIRGRLVLVNVLTAMVIAGVMQNAVDAVLPGNEFFSSIDDLLLMVAVAISIPRWPYIKGSTFLGLIFFGLLILSSVTRTSVSMELSLQLARSFAIPGLLMLVGLTLLKAEIGILSRRWILLSVATSIYVILEMLGIRAINPTTYALAVRPNANLFGAESLPGNYYYWGPAGEVSVRAGGTFLNPPVAGIFLAIGIVCTLHLVASRLTKVSLVLVQVVALIGTQGRAGYVIVVVGALLPWLVRRGGIIIALFGAFIFTWIGYRQFIDAGNSGSHVSGLSYGFATLSNNFFGVGFGATGNIVKLGQGYSEASESLIGVMLNASGLPFLALLIALVFALIRNAVERKADWYSYLGFAAIVAAAFSESVGSLSGASLLWILLGAALSANDLVAPEIKSGLNWFGRAYETATGSVGDSLQRQSSIRTKCQLREDTVI